LMPYDTFEKTKLLSTLSHSRQRQLIFWFIWFVWVKVEIFVTNFHLFLFWFPITFIQEIMIHGLNKINFLHHPQKDGKKVFSSFLANVFCNNLRDAKISSNFFYFFLPFYAMISWDGVMQKWGKEGRRHNKWIQITL
jgi:hypothetical protein